MFPATLAIDDPGVADELSLPTVAISKSGDVPPVKQLDISGEYSKLITEDFAVSFSPTWTHLYAPGGPNMVGASGFQNIETTFKYRVFKNEEHEFVASVGLNIEWGGSGAQDVGADRFTTYTPTFYFGKGFGDLPASMDWARPFALTGQLGYAIPSSSTTVTVDPDSGDVDTEFNPRILVWGASLQYSLPYLKSAVVDLGLPDFVNRLIPLVEASLQTPVSNVSTSGTVTTGTINPGVIWVGDTFQVGVEAMIPVNRQSGSSRRRHRADALLPRRHLPQLHRTADFRQRHRIREADIRQQAMKNPAKIAIVLAAILLPAAAHAHAFLDHASPKVGSTVASAPRELLLWFTEKLEPAFSTVEVRNAQGAVVSSKAQVAPGDGTELRVPLKALPPGTYSVSWRVLSVDTHRTQGSFTFRVGP